MLGKLLKYDLKWVYKVVFVFYILSFVFAILSRIFLNIENSTLFYIIGQITSSAMIGLIINGLVNGLIRSWVRFTTNIYKDESYLTHTLPVEKRSIYLSKVLTALICSFTSVIVALGCLFICYYSEANMEGLKAFLKVTADSYDISVISLLLIVSFVVFLEVLFIILIGYVAIIIGHRSNKNKMGKTFIYGIGLYFITSSLTLGIIYIIGLFNEGIMNIINTTEIVNAEAIKGVMIAGVAIYVIYNIIYYIIGNILFKKGVNVD